MFSAVLRPYNPIGSWNPVWTQEEGMTGVSAEQGAAWLVPAGFMINEPGKRSRGRWEILDSVSLYRERAELYVNTGRRTALPVCACLKAKNETNLSLLHNTNPQY